MVFPILKYAGDGEIHRVRDIIDPIADELGIPAEDRAIRVPSGVQTRLYNRITWAITYLSKAKLLARPARGAFQITDRGREVLKNPPATVHSNRLKWLNQFTEYVEFKHQSTPDTDTGTSQADDEEETPEEKIESSILQLETDLQDELLDQIKLSTPEFFEQLVIDVLIAMGYGGSRSDAGRAVGRSHDGGIDGIINEDRLGLDSIYVQAKRWDATVGRPVVQAFAGSLEGFRAKKGVFITTSDFAEPARAYVKQIEKRIVLIDGKTLARLMIDHDVGVSIAAEYRIRKIDQDYFDTGM